MKKASRDKIKNNQESERQVWDGINPQRKWGQHFLLEDKILQKELKQAQIKPEEIILEIGPGAGNLTRLLLARAKKVIAIEKDLQFKDGLENLQRENSNLELIWGDARYVKWPPADQLVANLPFKVALPVTFGFLEHSAQKALLIYQASQAKRLCAKAGKKHYGRLSVQVSQEADFRLIKKLPKELFRPAPQVDCALVRIVKKRSEVYLKGRELNLRVPSEEYFRQALEYFFFKRERRLAGALSGLGRFRNDSGTIKSILRQFKSKKNLKAYQIDPFTWRDVIGEMEKKQIKLPFIDQRSKRKSQKISF